MAGRFAHRGGLGVNHDRPRASLAPLIAATVVAAVASQSLAAPDCWPSSDLDGHIATIDLYRNALTHGVCWPFDRGAAFGHDAVPGYAWPFELLLGALAWLAARCGAADPARVVAVATIVATAAALPPICAWAAARLTTGDRRVASHAGALIGVAFLALPNADGATGHGMGAITAMGMINQGVGWCLLAALAGRTATVDGSDPARWRIDPALAALWAAVISVHTLSAIAGAVVLAVAALRHPRLVLPSLVAGAAAAAMAVSAIVATGARQLAGPWFLHHTGTDAFLALAGPLLLDRDWRQGTAAAIQVGALAVVVAGFAVLRRSASAATAGLIVAAVALTVLAAMPIGRALLPAAAQVYRLHPPALLLLMLAGAACAPALGASLPMRGWLRRTWVGAAWTGCFASVVMGWPQPCEPTSAAVFAEVSPHIPPGSRVAFADDVGWHRYAVDRWRRVGDWRMANAFHLLFAPPTMAGLAPAAASVGIGMQYPTAAEALAEDDALQVLADYGVDRLLRTRELTGPRRGSRRPPADLAIATTAHAEIWALPTAPEVEPIVGELFALDLGTGRDQRGILAEWWTRLRAERDLPHRLVFAPAGDPECAAGFTRADLDQPPPTARLAASGAYFTSGAWMERVGRAWATALLPIARRIVERTAPVTTAPAPATCTWSDDGGVATIAGLTPGRPCLWRVAYSSGFTGDGCRVLEEVGGLTVIIPDHGIATVRFAMPALAHIGIVISVLTGLSLTALALRRR